MQLHFNRPFITAEVGMAHKGDTKTALTFVREFAQAGADAIKFQAFEADKLNLKGNGLKQYELSTSQLVEIKKECERCGVLFYATPLSLGMADYLNDIGVEVFKVASGDITFYPLLEKLASFKKPVFLSTGASETYEIIDALKVLKDVPVILLHCISNYPTLTQDINMNRFSYLLQLLDSESIKLFATGFSDHTITNTAAIVAIASGMLFIEKHTKLNYVDRAPDWEHSFTPDKFKEYVFHIKEAFSCKSTSPFDIDFKLTSEEKRNQFSMRRGIYLAKDLRQGEVLTKEHIKYVRPQFGDGANPGEEKHLYGMKLEYSNNTLGIILADKPLKGYYRFVMPESEKTKEGE